MGGRSVEIDKHGQEWKDESLRGPPSRKPIHKGEHLLGQNVNHQGETGKRA